MAPDEGVLAQGAQGLQGGLAVRRISATPGHSLERGPDGAPRCPDGTRVREADRHLALYRLQGVRGGV